MTAKKETKNKKNTDSAATMENIISLCKRRGFIYQGSEIYGGLSGMWDYGHLGVLLKGNIKKVWLERFLDRRDDMYAVDAAIVMNRKVWQATGHASGFTDPMVECSKCKRRFRADHFQGSTLETQKRSNLCPECGGKLGSERSLNLLFQARGGPSPATISHGDFDGETKFADGKEIEAGEEGETSLSYLRPETAQGMFVNFKNVLDSYHPKLPFGLVQTGKAFRNEIAPRDFLFRAREFEQMEIEYFVNPKDWEKAFDAFRAETHAFFADVGLSQGSVYEHEIPDSERAFYSKRTIDFEYEYPFGKKELCGLAYRTDYDLSAHTKESGVDLSYLDEETKTRFVPHCIEPSFGLDRTVLAVLSGAYTEDEIGGEPRMLLKLLPSVAPVLVAVFPLLRNKSKLVEKAREIYKMLKKELVRVAFDDNGNIGKRYRRQDEIGTPYCVTIDFDTIEKDDTVTVRDRDNMEQVRVPSKELTAYMRGRFAL